jgi:protein phosphatase
MVQPHESVLSLRTFGATDIGLERDHNEDAILLRDDLGLYVVCDGAGGHDAGDVAANAGIRSIAKYMIESAARRASLPDFDEFGFAVDARRLGAALHRANRDVRAIAAAAKSRRGMGATVVALQFTLRSSMAHVAHAGDSRCYRWRDGHLEQLTCDHSMLNDVLEQRPDIDDGLLARIPRNAVTRALGAEDDLRVPLLSLEVVDGDRFLLCSDGLSGPVPAAEIAHVLDRRESPEETVRALIDDRSHPDIERDLRSSEPELLLLGIEELALESTGDDEADLQRVLAALLKR